MKFKLRASIENILYHWFLLNKNFKRSWNFCQKCDIFFGFFIVVQQNQGVQLKDRLFWAAC